MQSVRIEPSYFEGAVSVQQTDDWIKPWRIPYIDRALFPAPDDALVARAEHSSGVRLRFATTSRSLKLTFLPLPAPGQNKTHFLDVTVDGDLIVSTPVATAGKSAIFEGLPTGLKTVELWLPHDSGIALRDLAVEDGAACRPVADERPKWVTYGSSLTHCIRAHSPSRTWPAIVASRCGFNLTSLGYGGNCVLEPMVARMIRDLPASFISLKVGINCIGGALAPRTFPGAVLGLVQVIREKHPETPIALISPIAYPPRETEPNLLGYTIGQMRADIQDVHRRLVDRGDGNLYYFNGLDIFNETQIAAYTQDQCHPNGDGIELMAENFLKTVIPSVPLCGDSKPDVPGT